MLKKKSQIENTKTQNFIFMKSKDEKLKNL